MTPETIERGLIISWRNWKPVTIQGLGRHSSMSHWLLWSNSRLVYEDTWQESSYIRGSMNFRGNLRRLINEARLRLY